MLVRLKLTNFRNFQDLEFIPYEGFTVLNGPNGSGKSNLLESIYYLGVGYSYRQMRDENLVRWSADFFSIRGEVRQGSRQPHTCRLESAYQVATRRKITKINGKRELPGKGAAYLPVVIFSPQDLLLIQGSPVLRRRFLDLVVTQGWPQHAADINYYRVVLLQRNKLLRQGVELHSQLEPWDEQLIAAGSRIISRRLAVLARLLEKGRQVFETLGGSGALTGAYVSQVLPCTEALPRADEAACRDLFHTALKNARPLEERVRMTTLGPHRDDLKFFLDGHEVRLYCSQGEQRLVALSLKIGQSRILAEERQFEPLLLLDDVFSELDEKRRSQVLNEFCTHRQVIATTVAYSGDYVDKYQLTPDIVSLHVSSL